MTSKDKTKTTNKRKGNGKRKQQIGLRSPLVGRFLILITVLLAVLLMAEGVQIFLQFKNLTKKISPNPRPVYIVDSQPIDIDAYLREYFINKVPEKNIYVNVTAYSSTNGQTDNTPFLTAFGTPVRDGIIAANFLPVGTVVRFPDKFGEKIFVVEDRMHEKHGLQVDIWMPGQEEAKEFGIQYLKMEIF